MFNSSPNLLSVPSAITTIRSANEPTEPDSRERPEASWESTIRLQAGQTYAITVDQRDDAQTACCQILGSKTAYKTAWLVTCNEEPAEVIASLQGWEGPETLRLYRLDAPSRNGFNILTRLPRLITHQLRPGRHGLVMVAVPAAVLATVSVAAIERWLDQCNTTLRGTGSSLLLLFYGNSANTLERRLRPLHQALSGLAHLRREDGFAYYLIRHWRSDEGVTAAQRLALAEDASHRFQTVLHGRGSRRYGQLDADVYLAMTEAVEGVGLATGSLEQYADVHLLCQRAMQAHAATVIFAIDEASSVQPLAHILQQLRTERGDALALVIREMAPCLRYRDERILHACGVNVIVPHGMPTNRFLPMLESLRGNWAPRPVVEDPGVFFELEQLPRTAGLHDTSSFIQQVRTLLDLTSPTSHKGVLLVQRPVRGLTVEQAFGQYRLRRQGDLATLCDNGIVLFLYGLHPDQIPAALQRLCRLPVETLFAESLAYATDADIRTRLLVMATVDDATAALPATRALPRADRTGQGGMATKRNFLAQ